MKKKNAYFTVEATLVFPLALGVTLFLIFLLLYQYDRCIFEQEAARLALWGSTVESESGQLSEEVVKGKLAEFQEQKYIGWNRRKWNVELERQEFKVHGYGELQLPLHKRYGQLFSAGVEWNFRRMDETGFIRLCRKILQREED